MKISELQAKLEELKQEHGDIDVMTKDEDGDGDRKPACRIGYLKADFFSAYQNKWCADEGVIFIE